MKLVSYVRAGSERWGFMIEDGAIVDAAIAYDAAGSSGPPHSVLELVEGGPAAWEKAEEAAKVAPTCPPLDPKGISFRPPMRRPGKIVGVALNNSAFIPMAYRYFEEPAYFLKAPSSLIGHGEPIEIREEYGLTHPEPELACVIGERLSRAASEVEALSKVFGYTIMNDINSPGLKERDSIHIEVPAGQGGDAPRWRRLRDRADRDQYLSYNLRSNSTDTFGPMGPCLVSAKNIKNPDRLRVRSWLGDQQITEDSTANLSFSIGRVLKHLSGYMTLEPGDVIHFGSAAKPVKMSLRDANLNEYDGPVRIEIEQIGVLENPVVKL